MKQNLHCGDTLHLTVNFFITNHHQKLVQIDTDKLKLLIETVANNYINQCKTNAINDYFLSKIDTDKRMI